MREAMPGMTARDLRTACDGLAWVRRRLEASDLPEAAQKITDAWEAAVGVLHELERDEIREARESGR